MKMPGFNAENSFNKTIGYYEMTKIESLAMQGSIYPAYWCECWNNKQCGSNYSCIDAMGKKCIQIYDKIGGKLTGCTSSSGECTQSAWEC